MSGETVDLLILGGGINGAGIARDAAGRGLSVMLCEQGDLGGATSSASTKLIHGGLRYLEHYEFGLVREALGEREVLLSLAPHIIRPLQFILPHGPGLRPAWMIRLGLFLYDHLRRRKRLSASGSLALKGTPLGEPLRAGFKTGFHYADCQVDDARLVILNALSAAEEGAIIRPRTRCVKAAPHGEGWAAELTDMNSGQAETVFAKVLVNATGPWASRFIDGAVDGATGAPLRLVRGSHIVVPQLFDHDNAYIFQTPDNRIVFAIPYEGRFTMIGTTEVDHVGDPAEAVPSTDEITYLCAAVGKFFRKTVSPADVVWSFAGVRPLLDDGEDSASAATRDYRLELDQMPNRASMLSIFGGKITTYRPLAEHAIKKLGTVMDIPAGPWTADAPLPGGDIDGGDMSAFSQSMEDAYPWLPPDVTRRYARTYGSRMSTLLKGVNDMEQMGCDFGAGLYERELDYLVSREWATTAEDVLWRRTKLGLHGDQSLRDAVEAWFVTNGTTTGSATVSGGAR